MEDSSSLAGTTDAQSREWRPLQLVYLPVAAIPMFVIVFWAALGQSPLAGTRVETWLEIFFVILTNLSIGTLASGAVIEWRDRARSHLGLVAHIMMAIALIVMVVVDALVAWWVFASAAGALSRWLFLIVALAAIAVGAWSAWLPVPVPALRGRPVPRPSLQLKPIWPDHTRAGAGDWGPFTPVLILLGGTLGVVVAVAYLGISAWHENVDVPPAHSLPSALEGIHGTYVAVGDSYSAGEGLIPFVPGTAALNCDRSVSFAYPTLLLNLLRKQDPQASIRFTACSGALVSQVLGPTHRPGGLVPPEVSGSVQPSVGLVTLTIGGDDAIFSSVVENCLISGDCLEETFPPPGVKEATAKSVPPGDLLTQWGPGTIEEIGAEDAALFSTLRHDFPHARIVVIGYPYLFPDIPAPGFPYVHPMCSSILNRLSVTERDGIRTLQDEFDNRMYEEAVATGVEFVSPVAIWGHHEPCGSSGQYTNSVKPYLNFPDPINGGSFHPNAAGQQTLAALVGCYLDAYPKRPDPFAAGASHDITIPPAQLVSPSQLQLVSSPGLDSVPGSGTIPGC
jgi:hypothetical protein